MKPIESLPVDASAPAHVAILMATYNGAAHLPAQLESIAAQDHANWSLVVSDDGSQDSTRRILDEFAATGYRVTVLPGPGRGAAANFMSLLRRAPEHAPAGSFLALSDQDDVWMPDRLSRGLVALGQGAPDRPAVWCSRTYVTGPRLEDPRPSPPRPRPLSFRNALVQNVMAGNTILLNSGASQLASNLATMTDEVVFHDWWLYLILTGTGALVIHDDRPSLYYRQHGANEFGANDRFLPRLARLRMLFGGRMRRWTDINLAALERARPWLTAENAALADFFANSRKAPVHARLSALRHARLYRQTRSGTAALWIVATLGLL